MVRAKILGAALAVSWVIFGITLVILLTAGNGGYLADQMLRHAPPEVSRLPAADYPGIGSMIADYLTGKTDEFQYFGMDPGEDGNGFSAPVQNDTERACFNQREQAHMADCRVLIRLDRTVMILSAGTVLLLLGAGILMRREAHSFLRGILTGLRLVLAVALILGIWALVSFDGFFITFHRIAFTNDGWLLNPDTDLLIRLMPEEFFMALGVRGLMWTMIFPLLLEITARTGLWKTRSKDGK